MEISGQRLSIPRNFFFLNRLPARFEILVVARGANTPKGTAFELEIYGQRLMLHSKVDLKVGARYELEKASALEFKILSEKTEEIKEQSAPELPVSREKNTRETDAAGFFLPQVGTAYSDLLALRVLADAGKKIEAANSKYLFNFNAEIPLSGVFVPVATGQFNLFLSGQGIQGEHIDALAGLLAPLGIQNVRSVSPAILERISAGAVDIQS